MINYLFIILFVLTTCSVNIDKTESPNNKSSLHGLNTDNLYILSVENIYYYGDNNNEQDKNLKVIISSENNIFLNVYSVKSYFTPEIYHINNSHLKRYLELDIPPPAFS